MIQFHRLLTTAAMAAALSLLGPATALAEAATYTVDPVHSEVSFQVRHIVTQVRGYFRDFEASIVKDDEIPANSSVKFTVRVDSIDTDNERRDNHLRSEDFFWLEEHPEITFASTSVERVSDNEYSVTGPLTIRGVSRIVTLPVVFTGEAKDPWGNVKAGFSTSTKLDRKEFGLNWNKALDNGGFLLGDEVTVSIALAVKRES